MAHEKRAEHFPYLRARLGDVPFFVDKGKPGDAENLGIWKNCRRSWLAYDRDADWHFVLQDDSIVCEHFRDRLEKLLEKIGNQDFIISLYAGARYLSKAQAAVRNGLDYIVDNNILNENALGMRTKHIEEMVQYCDDRGQDSDRNIKGYMRKNKVLTFVPMPSLIQHRDGPSLYRVLYHSMYEDNIRQAVWYIDDPKPESLQVV